MAIRWNWVWDTCRIFEPHSSRISMSVCATYAIIYRLNEWWNARFFSRNDFCFFFSLNSGRNRVSATERMRKIKKLKTSSILTWYCHLLYDSATIKWFMCRSFYFCFVLLFFLDLGFIKTLWDTFFFFPKILDWVLFGSNRSTDQFRYRWEECWCGPTQK